MPEWAAVSFGVLLCLKCAGLHRSLGVNVSFVKSLSMDAWTEVERRCLLVGGNAKWLAVCTGTSMLDLATDGKYKSHVASVYRKRIIQAATSTDDAEYAVTAQKFLADMSSTYVYPRRAPEVKGQVSTSRTTGEVSVKESDTSSSSPEMMDDEVKAKCTTCGCLIPIETLNSHSSSCTVETDEALMWCRRECLLGRNNGSLGLSLTKTDDGLAEVTAIRDGGQAHDAGVVVGSFVVAVNDVETTDFNDIVSRIKDAPRPIAFAFAFQQPCTQPGIAGTITSVPEPTAIEYSITFHEKVLGCWFKAVPSGCFVDGVEKESVAQKKGLLVGSQVLRVNGESNLTPDSTMRMLTSGKRPLDLRLRRVEGLMRGWF